MLLYAWVLIFQSVLFTFVIWCWVSLFAAEPCSQLSRKVYQWKHDTPLQGHYWADVSAPHFVQWQELVTHCPCFFTVFGWILWRTDQMEFSFSYNLLFWTFWYNLTWTQPRRSCCSCISFTLLFIKENSLFSPVLHQLSECFSL